MAKQLNVDMRFTADTSKAKQSINELQSAIQKLGYSTVPKDVVNVAQFEQASAAARELAYHLNNAYNAKTGNLDLSKLNSSLKSAGTDLNKLTASFKDAGATGQQAFVSLAKAIANADQPAISMNTHLQTLFVTLKNVARFQISSSIIHGFMSSIQTAYGYAQDLNESLNNIRIVTGQSTEQMAKFAKQANEVARSLSATTLDYTDASLIYYQQGLNDAAVAERTAATIKLANVSRQSAQEVSDQMTAIWNNFDNGSHSLEYYADVITALGATTASSSQEIAGGMEKFAAVAETVGLSYEYAASALATIVATTRQSEDTVGTGLRTLFSRLEGLSLGQTLEDGTTLTKYSKALATIGVNIKDQNGELKDMDQILDEIGQKWDTLTKDQQVALAQTVGGVRQYTNLVALFDNWDQFSKNVSTALGSEGTLQKQADIYAESWEAARDRVKAATESLYDTLLDESFFIGLDNVIEHVLVGTNKFLENFGGIKALLVSVLSFVLSMTANKIGPAIQKIVQDIQIMTGGASKVYQKMQGEFSDAISNELKTGTYSVTSKAELESSQSLLLAKTKLGTVIDKLSASEKMRAELALSGYQLEAQEIKKTAQEVEALTKEADESAEALKKANDERDKAQQKVWDAKANVASTGTNIDKTAAMAKFSDSNIDFSSLNSQIDTVTTNLRDKLKAAFLAGNEEVTKLGGNFSQIFRSVATGTNDDNLQSKIQELKYLKEVYRDFFTETNVNSKQLNEIFNKAFSAKSPKEFQEAVNGLRKTLTQAGIPAEKLEKALTKLGAKPETLKRYIQALKEYEAASKKASEASENDENAKKELAEATTKLKDAQEKLNKEVNNYNPQPTVSPLTGILKGAAGLGQAVTLINSVKSAITTLGDDTATAGEKMTAAFMAISMGLPAAVGMISNFKIAIEGIKNGMMSLAGAYKAVQTVQALSLLLTAQGTQLSTAEGQAKIAEALASTKLVSAKMAEAVARNLTIAAQTKGQKLTAAEIIKTTLLTLLKPGEVAGRTANAAAMGAETGAALTLESVLTPLLVIVLAFVAALALIVAIGYGVVSIVNGISNAYNKDALAAEQAANAAKELTEAYNEAKSSYDSLKSSIEQYQNAKNGLAELTQGTQEWKDAIRNANEEAMNLINTYDEITSKDYSINKDTGLIEFNAGVLDRVLANKGQQVDNAFAASQMANARARQAQSQADLTQLKRDQHMSYWGGAGAGAATGALIGAAGGPVGVALGAAGGAAVGLLSTGAINADRDARIDAAIEALTTGALAEQFKNNQLSTKDLKEKLQIDDDALISAITELAATINHNSDQYELAANLITEQTLGDKYDEATKEIASEAYEQAYQKAYDKVMAQDNKITKWAGANNKDVKELWAAYSQATGTDYKLSSNAVQGFSGGKGSNSGRNYEYIDENGEKKLVNIETMASAIAASEALKQLGASAQQASNLLNNIKIDKDAGYSSSDIKNYIANGNFENSTESSIDAIKAAVETAGGTQAYLEKTFGGADKLKELADLQGISVDDFVKNFENSLNSVNFDTIGNNLESHVQAAFKNAQSYMGDLTAAQQKSMAQLFSTTYTELGKSGLDTLQSTISQLGESGQLDEFEKIASTFDWTSGSAADFKAQLIEAGIAVNDLNLDPWINGMIEAKGVIDDFATASSKYKTLHDIIDDIEVGDTLTPEQWEALGEGYEEYFILMGDGTHMLTGDAQAFYDAVNKQSLEGFANNIANAQENRNKIEDISSTYSLERLRGSAGGYTSQGAWIDTGVANAQAEFLETQGIKSEELSGIKEDLDAGNKLNAEQLKYLADTVKEVSAEYKTWDDVLKVFDGDAEQAEEAIATSAKSVGELQDKSEQYQLSQESIIKGYKKLATETEEGQAALAAYNEEMEGLEEGSEEARKATLKFQKAIKDIQANKAAQAIRDLNVNLSKLDDKQAQQVAAQLQTVFGKGITAEFVKNNHELVDAWLNGTKQQKQAAADAMETVTDMQGQLDNLDLSTEVYIGADGSEVALTAEQVETYKRIIADNPPTVDVNGHADMSQIVQSLMEAGMTAQQVANLLASVAETQVDFDAGSFSMPAFPESGDPDAVAAWMSEFSSQMANQGMNVADFDVPTGGVPDMTSGGGGGGGGGSSAKTHDEKEADASDRYKPIKAKIEDKERAMDQARDRADRLAGRARIDNLKEENKLLEDKIALEREYINEINNYLAQDKSDMLSALSAFGITVDFDENGVINNYDSIMEQLRDIWNEKANQELDEDTWSDFEDQYQDAIDAINQYIETRDLAEAEGVNLTDLLNEWFDQLVNISNVKLELNLEVNDQDLEFLDYLINKIDDDAYKAAEAIAFMGDKAARELERAGYLQNNINELLGLYGINSMEELSNMSPEEIQNLGITQEVMDQLISDNNDLLEILETLDDTQKEIIDKVISGFDDLNEKVQESYDYFSHWNTVLENYRDIVDLNMSALGGKQARDLIKTIDNSMLKNSVNALRSSKQIYDDLVEGRAEAEAKLQEAVAAGRIGDIKRYEDVLADIDEKIKDSQEQWLSDWSDGLQKAQDILTRAVEDAVKEYEKLLSPVYGSLDYLNEAYDRGKEVDEDYVQDYEKLYQLNKLNRDLTKVLGDTDGLKNKEQLIKLQEKINKLQKDNTKMSEYDLEVLRKEFEVQQARIALEEAANAKSTVRLQRDNEGNWGYVYTSDFDSTEELQQSYEDKLHEYQQLNDEYMSEMSDKLMELSQNARDKISEIWSDATLTQEEKEARVAEVMKWFNAQRNYIEEQMGHAIDNQAALTDRFYETYQNMQAQVRDTFAETVLSQTTNIEQLSQMTGLLTTGVANLVEAGRLASLEYLASMEEINEAAGSTMQDLADNITDATHEIDSASSANVETISELSEVVQEELLNALNSAIDQEERLAASIAATTAAIEDQTAALNNMFRILNDVSGESIEINDNPLNTLTQSEGQYGIDQPSYNENDWTLNKEIGEIFNGVYDEEKWKNEHGDYAEMYGKISDWQNLLTMYAANTMQGFGSIMSPYYQTPEADLLEQNVHIEANFPGVTDHVELQQAFENLVNKAAQFANRKRQG